VPTLNTCLQEQGSTLFFVTAISEVGVMDNEAMVFDPWDILSPETQSAISHSIVEQVWKGFREWCECNFREKKSFAIPSIGVLHFRPYKLGIKVPVLALSTTFEHTYGLKGPKCELASIEVVRVNLRTEAHRWLHEDDHDCPSFEIARNVLHAIFDSFGERVADGYDVLLELGFGTLRGVGLDVAVVFPKRDKKEAYPLPRRPDIKSSKPTSPMNQRRRNSSNPTSVSALWTLDGSLCDTANLKTIPHNRRGSSFNNASLEVIQSRNNKTAGNSLKPFRRSAELEVMVTSIASKLQYPHFVDKYSRTKCAIVDSSWSGSWSSDKIASFYSPQAKCIFIDPILKRLIFKFPQDLEAKQEKNQEEQPWYRRSFDAKIVSKSVPRKQIRFGEQELLLPGIADHQLFCVPREEEEDKASILQYEHYIIHGIPNNDVAPLPVEWMMRVTKQLPDLNLACITDEESPPAELEEVEEEDSEIDEDCFDEDEELSDDESSLGESMALKQRNLDILRNTLTDTVKQIEERYKKAVQKSVLDYALKDPIQRDMLRIRHIPRTHRAKEWGWGAEEPVFQAPIEWKESFELAKITLKTHLMVTHPLIRQIGNIWNEEMEEILLLGLPQSDDEAIRMDWKPATIAQVVSSQRQHTIAAREKLTAVWHGKVVGIFTAAVDAESDPLSEYSQVKLRSLFECAGTLMGNQMRQMVYKSLKCFVYFLDRLNLHHENNQVYSDYTASLRSAFTNELVIDDKKITTQTSLEQISNQVLHLFDDVAVCLNKLMRVEKLGIGISAEEDDEREMSSASFDRNTYIVGLEATYFAELRSEIEKKLVVNAVISEDIVAKYSEFRFILEEMSSLEAFVKLERPLEEYQVSMDRYHVMITMLKTHNHDYIAMGLQTIYCASINEELVARAQSCCHFLENNVLQGVVQRNISICKAFTHISNTVALKSSDTCELVEAERYILQVREVVVPELLQEVDEIRMSLEFLLLNKSLVTADLLTSLGVTFGWVRKIESVVDDGANHRQAERDSFEVEFKLERDGFMQELGVIESQIDMLKDKGDIRFVRQQLRAVGNVKELIGNAKSRASDINEEETKLGWVPSEFAKLNRIEQGLEPYDLLWSTAERFQALMNRWNNGPVYTLRVDQMEKETLEMERITRQLMDQFSSSSPSCASVAEHIHHEFSQFKVHLPLIAAISNDGLQPRHWLKISDTVGFALDPEAETTLLRIMELQIDQHLYELEAISEVASKEHAIENALETMKKEWESLSYDLQPYKESGTFILQVGKVDEIQTTLDDHLVKTQTLRNSPYCKFIGSAMEQWEEFLQKTSQTIEEWLRVQASWLYLDPVFSSEDIMKQMPKEGQEFHQVSSMWREIMNVVHKSPLCMSVAGIENLLGRWINANAKLEGINKGLSAYLEMKRLYFARFFFLSNDELLEILAETKDPTRVQPFLKKCFEGISGLTFKDGIIMDIQSAEDECVPLRTTITPADAKGAVEVWLLQLEQEMCKTLRACSKSAIQDFPTKDRQKWILDWPGQIVLATGSLFWTQQVENAFQSPDGLIEYDQYMTKQLDDLINLVRGTLTKLERCTLSALAVIDVHARDVVTQLMDAGVHSKEDFDWTSQLRYYWEQDTIMVKIIASELEYGYEYLGNSSRLVITPLTDRCYRTLMGAVHLQYGGAPEGPAGTGKTETTKDLAKALARQCVVFNCSDGLDYLAMAKFFKGLASSGAWACFDEFNRIELEVLSVVAQQISSIQHAIASRMHEFEFEGTKIQLRWTANVFITMNPGYAGRSELPDNLKSLFRTVAMMIPDYSLIAEIMLFSYGYSNSRDLANKITTTYTLCSEQLSSQDHYDYGMRAVISVLKAAGALKRQFPNEMEDVIVLRSICDVNLAKFLSQDIPLFKGIISDLFPGVVLPEADYTHLLSGAYATCETLNIQPVPIFMEKVIQLYEMIVVRHGLMVVGPPLAGKTSAWKVLQGALTTMDELKVMECTLGEHELAADAFVINPKAVTMGQLYGCFDPVSHEWSDGVLAETYRNASRANDNRRKWLLFDGPVDAVWIENLNTVLDDNKKLCLMSGEIIAMSAYMNLIFEPMDLAVASPATVSRCGMVYMEPEKLGWRPFLHSWSVTTGLVVGDVQVLTSYFESFVDPILEFVRRNLKELAPTTNTMLVRSTLQLLGCLFKDSQTEISMSSLQMYFMFATVWSFGASTDKEGRHLFDVFIRNLFETSELLDHSLDFPSQGTVFDFFVQEASQWEAWFSQIDPSPNFAKDASFSSIIVPTKDTVRYTYLLDLAVRNQKAMLFVGPTGTGKTKYTTDYLLNKLDPAKFKVLLVGFSAQTSAAQTQHMIDSQMDRRKRGVFGPSQGKRCVVFLDDVNMPLVETYGAQPPLELLRQGIKYGGWYDLKDRSFRNIVDCQFVGAMGPPGGGRNFVSPRFMRHFHIVGVTEFEESSMQRIYKVLTNWYVNTCNEFPSQFGSIGNTVVNATIEIYNTAIRHLLPTPLKSHYLFNMRDISRVIQGITLATDKIIGKDVNKFTRLWMHEIIRVFGDRLVDDLDRDRFVSEMLLPALQTHFGKSFQQLFSHFPIKNNECNWNNVRQIMFTNFLNGKKNAEEYDEISDIEGFKTVCEQQLMSYNAISNKPMKLVMFAYAIEHLVRISRIISIDGGNALLVGLGGSGRQSLTRLAAFVNEFDIFQIELRKNYQVVDWHDDLKKVLRLCGGKGKHMVLLVSDAQLKYESFLEDINCLLNSGEVPNMLAHDEKAELCEMARTAAKSRNMETADGLYAFVIERVQTCLHIVLAFSPIGDAFRSRIRMFPSLVNCCSIDWFSEWPEDALTSVAESFLNDVSFGETSQESKEFRSKCVDLCKRFHVSTITYAQRYLAELNRYYYVTPTSYLELIHTFKSMLGVKRSNLESARQRYHIGLEKLKFTEDSVQGMQKELQELQPSLVDTEKQTVEMMKVVETEQLEADKIATVVKHEELVANEKAQMAKSIKDECEGELAEAMPILESAIQALNTLSKNDITEVKSMKSPPDGVKLVMEAMCVMLDVKPVKVKDLNDPSKKINDYWEPAKKQLLSDPKFLNNLMEYDKDNIDAKIVSKVEKFCEMPEFDPAMILKASNAAHGLCCWVRAMVEYDKVAKVVAPKRAALEQAETEFEVVMMGLREKQSELDKVEKRVAGLAHQLAECKQRKQDLQEQVNECTVKLDRAEKLISGLGGEKSRWEAEVQSLMDQFTNVTGNVLICSGVVAYLGAFTVTFRREIVQEWTRLAVENQIPCSRKEDLNLIATIGEPVKIRNWNIQGLPIDDFSVENGIIVDNSRRWPLMIDPQGQANKWIRNLEKENGLEICKLTDPNFMRKLENCIQFGKPLLLENIGETLPATLEPLLLKQVFSKGGVTRIKLGDAIVEYSPKFRFYMTTRLRSPHYLPDVSVKVTLLNFMITPVGIEDQLLGILVAKERPDLETSRSELIVQSADNKKTLKEIEDKILHVMSSSQGNILEDATAIEILSKSQAVAKDISEKQKIAEQTEKEIDEARDGYLPIASKASTMFFCIADIVSIDPMYQYSLNWFIELYETSIGNSEPFPNDIFNRLQALEDHFTFAVYRNVCRSLFEKDKLLFSFMLCTRLLQDSIPPVLFRFFISGGMPLEHLPVNPCADWLPDKCWSELNILSREMKSVGLECADTLIQSFGDEWKEYYDCHAPQNTPLPGLWNDKLDAFTKLCVLRCIRPDKMIAMVFKFVSDMMGSKFVEPPAFELRSCWEDSKAWTPLIFILSAGSDPMTSLSKFSEQHHIQLTSLSLGQGQGALAEKLIRRGIETGSWVALQNCHLFPSWMSALEQLLEEVGPQLMQSENQQFRLWLTSYPSKMFPASILQNGVKMTNEAPKGLRANLVSSYMTDPIVDSDYFETCKPTKARCFKKLLFGLCFFHAVIQERRDFGALGWNIPYEFNESDLRISARQLKMFLESGDEQNDLPFKALKYTIGECNYGGRVTDENDRRTMGAMLELYLGHNVAHIEHHSMSSSGTYVVPKHGSHSSYLEYLRSLPVNADPEVYGLNENANISKDIAATHQMLEALLLTQPRIQAAVGQATPEQQVEEVAINILAKLDEQFDMNKAHKKYPVMYSESMNTVLCQELSRYNTLTSVIRDSLCTLIKATQGLVVMSLELESVFSSILVGKIPEMWRKKSFPSLKNLHGYVQDLYKRLNFFQNWFQYGPPSVFWISGIFFTHGFLTGVLQNAARRNRVSIDGVQFDYLVLAAEKNTTTPPAQGVYVNGLFLEGARWNPDSKALDECLPKVLHDTCPLIHMLPTSEAVQNTGKFKCPLYKTNERRGTLSTTGHSTNFVMYITLPSNDDESHWIRRGVALLTQLPE